MEEIDRIIIDSLKNLKCSIDEDTSSVKQFDVDTIVNAISICLETIGVDKQLPRSLPPSMSARLKITTTLAQHIRNMGFKEEIGYQTILYCNEAEIRRVFMFLIERLPRETTHKVLQEDASYVTIITKKIESVVLKSLEQLWVPEGFLDKGCRFIDDDNDYLYCSTTHSHPLDVKNLKMKPLNNSDAEKHYFIHNVPKVTDQCDRQSLLASLLFTESSDYQIPTSDIFSILKSEHEIIPAALIQNSKLESKQPLANEEIDLTAQLVEDLRNLRDEYADLQESIRKSETQLKQLQDLTEKEEHSLEQSTQLIVVKRKTLKVLDKEENLQKLKNIIETTKNRLILMAEKWKEIQNPLLEEYKSLQGVVSDEDRKKKEQYNKVDKLRDVLHQLQEDLNGKTKLEQELRLRYDKLMKNTNRAGYTRRIIEIITNIRKQDEEIRKVLKDTEEVQKAIKQLTGQVERSFTLSDELIYQDAPHDETARKSYKLLAQLRDDCTDIITSVKEVGTIERECRNLQDQIETESSKEYYIKLEKVNNDLIELQKENQLLINKARLS